MPAKPELLKVFSRTAFRQAAPAARSVVIFTLSCYPSWAAELCCGTAWGWGKGWGPGIADNDWMQKAPAVFAIFALESARVCR